MKLRSKSLLSQSYPLVFLLLCAILVSPTLAMTPVSGEVYRDFNNSGVRETLANYSESPVDGVEVRAYAMNGALLECNRSGPTDCTGAADGDAPGQYTLALPTVNAGDRIRLEFVNLPDNLQPGIHSLAGDNGRGTTVRFLTSTGVAFTGIDLPLTSIGDFCGGGVNPNPTVISSCYVFGDQTGAASTVVSFPYNSTGDIGGTYTPLLNESQTGSVYGFAYHQLTDNIFFANYIKRHSGSTPGGGVGGTNLDALYVYHRRTGALNTLDLSTLMGAAPGIFGTDGRTAGWDFLDEDDALNSGADNWGNIGKNGIGDIDVSSDGTTLYISNLAARRVEVFTINSGTPTASGFSPSAISLTYTGAIGPVNPGCVNGVARVFGLGYQDGDIFSGWVCTGESPAGTPANLSAHVYRGNTRVFSMPLTFNRGCVGADQPPQVPLCTEGAQTTAPHSGDWQPWSNGFSFAGRNIPNAAGTQITDPQPMLTDIEFDNNGDLILGFRDRLGDLVGYRSSSEPGNDVDLYSAWAGGDLYRVCRVGTTYVLEGDASGDCARPGARDTNGDGPNGGEFYPTDGALGFGPFVSFHGETFQGALLQIAGLPEVVSSSMDPTNLEFTGGFRTLGNVTGNQVNQIQLYGNAPGTTFGKGNGIGDLEAICPPPPLEIGNLVWLEDVRDGVQATGTETTVAGILLELIDPATGLVIATTMTDATGHYYFNATDATWDANADGIFGDNPPLWDIDGDGLAGATEPRGIMPFTRYTVRVANSNFNPGNPLENYFLTNVNIGSGTRENGFLMSDSEGLTATITTGAFGVNNHTIDFGFTRVPPPVPPPPPGTPAPESAVQVLPQLSKTVAPAVAAPGSTVTWTITVTNPSDTDIDSISFKDVMPDELIVVSASATDGSVVINGQTISFNLAPLAARQSVVVSIITRIRDDVPASIITNTVRLLPFSIESQGALITVSKLPATGE
ncbi:MAG: SdrD B-like domain-containing protein [Aggregatilineales bacterium]